MYTPFTANFFVLKKQILALTGTFRLYDQNEQMVAYSRQKMFKLREDIRVYADEDQRQELLYIQARQILDFSAAYDVRDSQSGELVGTLRRRGLRSMLRDEWDVLAPGDQPVGTLIEDNMGLAMLRRLLLGNLLPQNYDLLVNEQRVMDLKQRFNIFRYELVLDFSFDTRRVIDHRLGIAAGILLAAIEGRQE
jgi:uncharacterized protein YxjI